MANLIELIARWRDEGVDAGLARTSRGLTILTNAIGVGLGAGAIASVAVLARQLGNLARAPFVAADSFAKLAASVKAGSAEFDTLAAAVGRSGIDSLTRLSEVTKDNDKAWQEFGAHVAASVAPMTANFKEVETSALNAFNATVRFLTTGGSGGFMGRRGGPIGTSSLMSGQPFLLPQPGTAAQEAYARFVEQELEKTKKITEERQKQAELFRQMIARESTIQIPGFRAPGPQILPTAGERMEPIPTRHWFETIGEWQEVAASAAESISFSIESTFANFNNKMMTIGLAAQRFWNDLTSSILAAIGRLAAKNVLGPLFGFIGAAIGGPIGGPIGGFIGAIGGELIGRRSASMPRIEGGGRGGNTFVLQGFNTRDMYMELTNPGGSVRRANDLVLMRSEAG